MGELTRQFDWSKTSVGSLDQWPQSLRTIVDVILHSRFPMFLWWGRELIQFYNDAYRPSLGNNGKHPTALGQPGEECWPEIWPVIKPLIDQVFTGGESTWSEDQLIPIYRNGNLEDVYWTFSYSPVKDESGQIAGVLVTCAETTTTVMSRKILEESQRELLTSFEQFPVAIAIISEENLTFRMANPFYGYLVGRPPGEIIGKPLFEALPELQGQGFDRLLREVIRTGKPYVAFETSVDIVRQSQLETIYVDLIYQPRREANGLISGILVVATDVSHQVRARKKIEEDEARFRSLIAQAPVATGLFVGPQLIVELANEPMLQFWGKGPDVFGKPLAVVLPELMDQPFMKILETVYTTGKPYQALADRCDLVMDGQPQTFYFNFTYQPIFNKQGQVYAIMDMAVDVTEQVIAIQQLKEAESSLRVAVEMAQLGTWSIDVATNGLTFSDRLIEWFGYDPQTRDYAEVIPILEPADQQRIDRAVAWALNPESDGIYDETYTVIHPKTGQKRILHAHGKTVFDASGKAIRLNGTAQDITLQRELQLALEAQVQERTEDLASANAELEASNEELEESNALLVRSNDNLQKFAYVASHDLQEPLRKIQQFGDLLKNQYAAHLGDGTDLLDRMQTAAIRMSLLIKDLLTFSRISSGQDRTETVSLTQVINFALTDLELVIEETGAQVTIEALPAIQGDAGQLGQLFQNLLSNALKFRRPGIAPAIRIRSRTSTAADLPVTVKPARLTANYYCISVSDNGIGFDEKYVDRIFQVFQRLHGKSEFAGTGIGLAICEKVAANHGGMITATSQPGQGATFSVYIPVLD